LHTESHTMLGNPLAAQSRRSTITLFNEFFY
jgi:hypothetical protein